MTIFFLNPIPSRKYFFAVRDLAWLDAENGVERIGRNDCIAGPLNAGELVDRPRFDRDVNWNFIGQFFCWRAAEANFGRTEFQAEVALLDVAGANLLGKACVYGEAGVRFAAELAEMSLDRAILIERGIPKADGGDLQGCALDGETLHIAVADRIGHDLMFHNDVELVGGEQRFDC